MGADLAELQQTAIHQLADLGARHAQQRRRLRRRDLSGPSRNDNLVTTSPGIDQAGNQLGRRSRQDHPHLAARLGQRPVERLGIAHQQIRHERTPNCSR